MTTNPNLTDLATTAATLTPRYNARYQTAITAATEAATQVNRLALAQILLDAEIPENAHVTLTDWADEPNGDGTYDMDVDEAYLPAEKFEDEEVLDNIGGSGAIAAGHVGGGTDWDIFMLDAAPKHGIQRIEVAKVYTWLRNQATKTA